VPVDRLVLTDFRNHADTLLRPGGGFVVLTGDNGAGKTNVLEALSLLAPGRGLRRAPLSEMARQGGSGGFGVAATLGDLDLGTGTQPGATERRIVRINGATAAATSLAERVTMLWLTPAMDRLFVEPASERRRLLDRLTLALAPMHAHHSNRYEAAMRERNRLLAEAADGAALDAEWLGALEARMAEHGAAIAEARTETVSALDAALRAAPAGPFARAGLALEGWSGNPEALALALRESRRRDMAAGRTLVGPHRGDLLVTHLDKSQPAHLCSTGEQKALLLALVLAHAELVAERIGRAPILLLDEVAAHLDPMRRAALFERLAGKEQVWMTGTEAGLFIDAGCATRYRVSSGAICED
jgi:DNA replication and repair protein RecF